MNKEQMTVRLSDDMYKYIQEKAAATGASSNSIVAILCDLGKQAYEAKLIAHLPPK